MRDFRKLQVWADSIDLVERIYKSTEPYSEGRGRLIDQIRKSAVSIPSNIAEGCRGSLKELRYFMSISLGSAFELETQLLIAGRTGILTTPESSSLIDQVQSIEKRLIVYIRKIDA